METVKLFEYKKSNKSYWDRPKLYKQVVNKVLPIVKTLYIGYLLLFCFDNITSHFVFTQDASHIIKINKKTGKQNP